MAKATATKKNWLKKKILQGETTNKITKGQPSKMSVLIKLYAQIIGIWLAFLD
jgi:hypothetical protein